MIRITESQIKRSVQPGDAIRIIEKAFKAFGRRQIQMPPKVYLNLHRGDFRAMPSSIEVRGRGVAGIKWISVFPKNSRQKLPVVIGSMILNDIRTGVPLAFVESNTLTALRTGAAGAVASRWLARPDSKHLLLVGAGVQATYQLKCHLKLFRFSKISVCAPKSSEVQRLRRQFKTLAKRIFEVKDLKSATSEADIICTCTPSRKPILKTGWIQPGTHINAIGADAKGKQELEVSIIKKARTFVDDWQQASHSGELNTGYFKGQITKRHIQGELSDVILKRQVGRRNRNDITLFDSTGLAAHDLVLADYIYRKLIKR